MARLRDIRSGAVVSVTDEKAARMGTQWVPADDAKPSAAETAEPPTPKRRRTPAKK